jgi:hypothetical protein
MGHATSKETRQKISAANRGHGFTEEALQKMRRAKEGKTLSEEHKRKLREAHKLRLPISEETRRKLCTAATLREKRKRIVHLTTPPETW